MNKLRDQASLYLQQHANNPVHWQPYSQIAVEAARKQQKLIFLSIGYSSCHWCHVMARESFEDQKTADYLNEHFINIKVDREELPGLDKVYQELYQIMNHRGGGWPLSVWMTPDAKPFFIGTYFPDKQKYQMPSFMQVSTRIVELWNTKREELIRQSKSLEEGNNGIETYLLRTNEEKVDRFENILTKTINSLEKQFDWKFGGVGDAPKFPRVATLRLLLHYGFRNEKEKLIKFVEFTFEKMMNGGIYDHVGGGFARYSVDREWLVPHFEKMLYDNGLLLTLGSEIYSITKNEAIKQRLDESLSWLLTEMQSQESGFYSALNAESEGEEGKFYVWAKDEAENMLGNLQELGIKAYGITQDGNFKDPHNPKKQGMNVLTFHHNQELLSKEFKMSAIELRKNLQIIREKMYVHREKRIRPDLDDKVITSWNMLVIVGMLKYAQYCEEKAVGSKALRILDFITKKSVQPGYVKRYYKKGAKDFTGVLDDYAFFIDALIEAYEYCGNNKYLKKALELQNLVNGSFYDKKTGLLYLVQKAVGNTRPIQVTDDSMPSGYAITVQNLFKLGKYYENQSLIEEGKRILSHGLKLSEQFLGACNQLLLSGSYYRTPLLEIVSLGEGKLFEMTLSNFMQQRLVYRGKTVEDIPNREILQGRSLIGNETLYVCKNMTCSLPITIENYSETKFKELIK